MSQNQGIDLQSMLDVVQDAVNEAKKQMDVIKSKKDQFSICDMFQMQMVMNTLSQTSEMSSAVVSACNTSLQSLARAIKQ